MTQEAEQELIQLKQDADYATQQESKYRSQGLNAEAGKWGRKWGKLYDKLTEMENLGLSTNEKKAVIKALPGMFTVSGDKQLGSSSALKVGFVPKLNSYVKVEYTKFSSFMRNVRGCASLAGKYDLKSVTEISKEVYDKITKGVEEQGGAKHEVHFAGAHETTIGGVKQEESKSTPEVLNDLDDSIRNHPSTIAERKRLKERGDLDLPIGNTDIPVRR